MKNIVGNIHDKARGESEKECQKAEGKVTSELNKEKEIVETLTYKLGISEDELHNYIDEL